MENVLVLKAQLLLLISNYYELLYSSTVPVSKLMVCFFYDSCSTVHKLDKLLVQILLEHKQILDNLDCDENFKSRFGNVYTEMKKVTNLSLIQEALNTE